ncbi:MAG: TonB-dependent receptor [Bacteroidota bacterium]
MKHLLTLWLCLLGVPFCLWGQTDPCRLQESFSLSYEDRSLIFVLGDLRERLHLPLSYSPDRIPELQLRSFRTEKQTLKTCLDQLLKDTDLEYRCIGGQIVIFTKLNSSPGQGQEETTPIPRQTIRGRIWDKDSQQPIPFAAVFLPNTEPLRGAYSDENGYFRINRVEVGRYKLQVSHVEYQPYIQNSLLISTGKEVVLELQLIQKINTLNTVQITDDDPMATPLNPFETTSYQGYEVEEARRYPASYGDPARHAQSFAGLIGQNDIRNEIVVRGNNPRSIMWMIDGVEVPNPNHFGREGTSSGSISMVSTNLLENSEFLTGAFPAQYGNATGGIFDLRIRQGNDSTFEHSIELGTLGLEVASEGPIGRRIGYKGSYLINMRSSVLNVIGSLLDTIIVDEELTNYQDLALKLHFPTRKGAVDVLALYGNSSSGLPRDERRRSQVSGVQTLGIISYRRAIRDNAYLKSSLSAMTSEINNRIFDTDSLDLYDQRDIAGKAILRWNWLYHKRFSRRFIAELGGVQSWRGYNFQGEMHSTVLEPPFQSWTTFDTTGITRRTQFFFTGKYRFSEDTEFIFGLHFLRHRLIDQQSLEPRLGFRYRPHQMHRMRLSLGWHSRLESLEYYFHLDPLGEPYQSDLKLPKALHFVAGYDFLPHPDWAFTMEMYVQYLYNLPIAVDSSRNFFSTILQPDGYYSGELVNRGEGLNQGVELSLHKRFGNGWYALASGSLFQSIYRARDRTPRFTPFHGPLQYAVLAGKEFSVGRKGKPHLLSLNGKFFYNNQQRLVVLDPTQPLQSNRYIQHFSIAQCPDCEYYPYWRFDIQLIHRRNHKRFASVWRADIQNFTARNNIREITYDPITGQARTELHFRLLPVLSYRIEF